LLLWGDCVQEKWQRANLQQYSDETNAVTGTGGVTTTIMLNYFEKLHAKVDTLENKISSLESALTRSNETNAKILEVLNTLQHATIQIAPDRSPSRKNTKVNT
jgi:hypothetical protein